MGVAAECGGLWCGVRDGRWFVGRGMDWMDWMDEMDGVDGVRDGRWVVGRGGRDGRGGRWLVG